MKRTDNVRGEVMPIALTVIVAILGALPVIAQQATPIADETISRTKGGPGKGGDKPDFPEFKEVIKEHKEIKTPEGESGFFVLYYNGEDDQLLCEIPKKMLGRNFLLANSIASGPRVAGYMWGSRVVQWHEIGKQLVLIQPDLRYKKPEGRNKPPVADVIERTYTDTIVTAVPIVTKNKGNPVIDLGTIFKRDYAGLGRVYGGSMNSSLSRWVTHKAFPRNVEVEVEGVFMRGNSNGTRANVHYSMIELPNNDYKPRVADPRIGYFMTAIKDWTTPHEEETTFHRLIHRWDVRKAEPNKAISDVDPDHQITFYIEKTVPIKYRRYVREGILEWNKAFEKAGLRNAIKVEQQTDTVHADKDPEDVRYAFFRWIVSGRTFAMGPSLANPLTGQILDADIIMDDSMVRVWEERSQKYGQSSLSIYDDPELNAFLKRHPEWDFNPVREQILEQVTASLTGGVQDTAVEADCDAPLHMHSEHGRCNYAEGLAHDMAFNMSFLEATGKGGLSNEFVGQMIKEVVTHEVGHTLGLRHNFKASSWKSMDEILSNDDPNVATCASVMDYIPGVFPHFEDKTGLYISQTIGPYDEWAIMYGYTIHDKSREEKNEKEMIQAIASRCAEQGHAFATDEDTTFFSPDPLVNRWDHSSDVIEYTKHRMNMVRTLQKNIGDWAVKDGESYHKLRRAFNMLLFEYGNAADLACRYVGGQYINRHHKGDPDAKPPIEIVPVEKQREALEFVLSTVFSDEDFQFDPELLNKLAAGRWGHWGSDAFDSDLTYPVHDRILAVQRRALFRLINPFTLDRVFDAEVKVPAGEDAITVPELIESITGAVWFELDGKISGKDYTARKPFISSIRRNLQRAHLDMLFNILMSRPGGLASADINAVVAMNLEELSGKIKRTLEKKKAEKLDDFTRAHLMSVSSRIDRALKAKYQL